MGSFSIARITFLMALSSAAGAADADIMDGDIEGQLPVPPKALPAEVSPFEPRWFAGPGKATVSAKGTAPTKGIIKIDGDKVFIDSGSITINVKSSNVERVAWNEMEKYIEADKLLKDGLFMAAALKYSQILNELRQSLLAAGTPAARLKIESEWYAKGRMSECQLKADHLDYCYLVFESPLAAQAQIDSAARMYLKLAVPGGTRSDRDAVFERLVSQSKVALSAEEQQQWDAIKRRGAIAVAGSAAKPVSPAVAAPSIPVRPTQVPPVSTAPASSALSAGKPASTGAVAPALKPELLALTYAGGSGEQWIQEVGFMPDGQIFGKGTGFNVFYAPTGKYVGTTGDLNTPSTGGKGRSYAVRKTFTNPYDNSKWEFGYKQVHKILQQPFLVSPHGWKWWDWSHDVCKERELMADSRGVNLLFCPRERFIAMVWRDGGNSSITMDPRDLDKKNIWTHRGGGTASYYMLGDCKTGEPLAGIHYAFRPGAEAVDAWGRFYTSQTVDGKPDALNLGGAGLSIYDAELKECLFNTSLGGDRALSIALRENILVIGGVAGRGAGKDKKGNDVSAQDAKLNVKNPSQEKAGGGVDGFLAIFKLW